MKKSFLLLALPLLAFTDVPEDSYYYDAIEFLESQEVVQGYSDGSFGYNLEINRAEMLKILFEEKNLRQPENIDSFESDDCFSDVDPGLWYTKYICYAKDQNWISGYNDGSFKPDQKVIAAEAIKMMITVNEIPLEYTSIRNNEPWELPYLETAANLQLTPLTIDNEVRAITRAEMADMIASQHHYQKGSLENFLDDRRYRKSPNFFTMRQRVNIKEVDDASDSSTIFPISGNEISPLGLTINAPSGYYLYWDHDLENVLILDQAPNSPNLDFPVGNGYASAAQISFVVNEFVPSYEFYVQLLQDYESGEILPDQTINGKNFKRMKSATFGTGYIEHYFLEKNGRMIEFRASGTTSDNNTKDIEMMEELLSSLPL